MTDVPASPPSPEGTVPEGTVPSPARARSISTESGDFPVVGVETNLDPTRMPLLRFLLKLPLKKLTIWGACVLLLFLLWDFFPLIFMTFVLSYIATSVVGRVEGRFRHRAVPVTIFFSCVVALVVGFAFLTVPQITAKARELRGTSRPQGLATKRVSVAHPRTTRTTQDDPRWSWIALPWPLRHPITRAS